MFHAGQNGDKKNVWRKSSNNQQWKEYDKKVMVFLILASLVTKGVVKGNESKT